MGFVRMCVIHGSAWFCDGAEKPSDLLLTIVSASQWAASSASAPIAAQMNRAFLPSRCVFVSGTGPNAAK